LIYPDGKAGSVYTPTHPHPYFGCKILVFMRLQAVHRCKIVKTKELTCKIVQDKELGGVSASVGGILAAR
jgi:hypothetical protein